MPTTVQKWGNSLGIRVPKAIAEQLHLTSGSEVELETADGVLTIRPVRTAPRRRSKYRIHDLLAKCKGPYPHRGVFDDPPVGRELL